MREVVSFNEWLENGLEDRVTDLTNNGKCSNCGHCCINSLPMNKQEVDRIKKYIKAHDIKPYDVLAPYKNLPYNTSCPFCNEDKKICTIYEVRPKVCRTFLCNDEEKVKRNRDKFHSTMKLIDARREFF